jgi:thioredoxin 1
MSPASAPSSDTNDWLVICLCAQWCGTCRDWRPALEQFAASHPGLRFAWVDIEDQADEVGDIDIETFPTLLIAHGPKARFLGPVLPQAAQISRLLGSLRDDERAGLAPPEAQALLDRLRATKLKLI